MVAGIFFGLLVIAYNFTLRCKVTFRNIVINKPRIAVYTAVTVAASGFMVLQRDTWYTQSYINSVPVVEHNSHKIDYNDETGVYTITKSTEDFKILHLTDIHIGGSLYSYRKDMKALKACYAEIEHTHPDLVVVTGDLSFPLGIMSMSLNNTAPVGQFAGAYSALMLAGAVAFTTCVIPHHVICGLVEWFYIRLGRTDEARKAVLEFFRKTSATMIICYLGLLLFSVSFFIAVVTGTTSLPRWACVFNTLPLFLALSPFKVAGSGNIANGLMFLALIFSYEGSKYVSGFLNFRTYRRTALLCGRCSL